MTPLPKPRFSHESSQVATKPELEKHTRRKFSNDYKLRIIAEADACQPGHLGALLRRENLLLPAFLVWLLNQRHCQRYFDQNAEGSVTRSIRRSALEAAPIDIPTLEKQQAVMQLVNTLKQEQQVLHSLVQSNEALLGSIATDLISEYSPTP